MIAAILCLLSAISILIFLPQSPGVLSCLKEKPCLDKSIPPISDEYPRSYIFGLLMILGLLLVSRMIPQSSFSLYIIDIYKESHLTTGFCYGLQALGLVVSATCWARYFENKNIFESMKNLSFIALACLCVTLLMACLHEIKLFILLYFLWGILLGGTTPVLMALISKSAGMKQQGYVLGLAQSISQFSSIIGITIGGVIGTPQLKSLYFYVAFAYFVTFLMIIIMRVFNFYGVTKNVSYSFSFDHGQCLLG